ncbi:MAG: HupE/UreJ family protein, partial [Sinobacteraceae bacterium]|nr:HupE/UreJ family protein [Nevskiaceae bacterium]
MHRRFLPPGAPRRFFLSTLCLLCVAWACPTSAHDRSESNSHWTYAQGNLRGIITIRTREITRLSVPGDREADLTRIFVAHVRRSIAASMDGTACEWRAQPAVLGSEPGFVRVAVHLGCPPGARLELTSSLLFAVAPSHHHFIYVEAGESHREAILTHAVTSVAVPVQAGPGTGAGLLQFVRLGIEHILTGVDHLAFLVALLIGARGWRQIIAIVSGFTLGHSLTLSLAVLGILTANRTAIECLIGLTIAIAAAQNLIRASEARIAALVTLLITLSLLLVPAQFRTDLPGTLIAPLALLAASAIWLAGLQPPTASVRGRCAMAVGFGLIHGLGFAGALQDLQLPRRLLLTSLFGFNVGVEAGQLVVVGAAWALVRLTQRALPRWSGSEVPAALA